MHLAYWSFKKNQILRFRAKKSGKNRSSTQFWKFFQFELRHFNVSSGIWLAENLTELAGRFVATFKYHV